jgi:caffeoyl-CoA O-methyltransferase
VPDHPKSFLLNPEMAGYLEDHSLPADEHLLALRERTAALGDVAAMQIAPEQGALLTVLTAIVGTSLAIEVGTFTGYSSICIARGMAADGRLICCDVSDEWTTMARQAWLEAGVADRIDLRLGPAAETLARLPSEATVDLAFIDADKGGYAEYYELLLPRMRPGGVILADNTLWSGKVVDPGAVDADTTAIRSFNAMVAADERVDHVLLPVADGVMVARKR